MARILDEIMAWPIVREATSRSIATGRWPHCALLVGPAGIGKSLFARALAQALLCERKEEGLACGICPSCLQVQRDQHPALLILHPEGQHYTVDQARKIHHSLSLRSLSTSRVIVLQDAHLLGMSAGNALLKILEEPPSGVFFILTATATSSILPTIRSRSQTILLSSLPDEEVARITEKPLDDWKVKASQGSVERALELGGENFQGLRAFALKLLQLKMNGKMPDESGAEVFKKKEECLILLRLLMQILRDLQLVRIDKERLIHSDFRDSFSEFQMLTIGQIDSLFREVQHMEEDWRLNVDRSLLLETWIRNGLPIEEGTIYGI